MRGVLIEICVDHAQGLTVPEVAAMASSVPAAFLGLVDRGTLLPGMRADLAWLAADLKPRGTWIGGVPAWPI